MTEDHKITIRHYVLDIIPIALFLLTLLVGKLFFSRASYISGLLGSGHFMLFWPLLLLLLLLFAASLFLAFVNFVRVIIKACKVKKVQWLRVLLSLSPFLICLLYFVGVFSVKASGVVGEAGAVKFLRGYEKWVQKEVDIASIQEWLISLDTAYSGKFYFEAEDFPEELPTVVTNLKPYHISFSDFDGEQRSVKFEWGSAMGHWGIIIGLPGMETPKEEDLIKHSESEWEYRRPIQSGVYIFDRG